MPDRAMVSFISKEWLHGGKVLLLRHLGDRHEGRRDGLIALEGGDRQLQFVSEHDRGPFHGLSILPATLLYIDSTSRRN